MATEVKDGRRWFDSGSTAIPLPVSPQARNLWSVPQSAVPSTSLGNLSLHSHCVGVQRLEGIEEKRVGSEFSRKLIWKDVLSFL